MAAKDLNAPEITTIGIQYILLNVLGDVLGKTFLIAVIIAVMVCALAVHTAAVQMAFAMARDTNLPFSKQIAKISPRFGTPLFPVVAVGVIAALVLV
jgi:amino acid transporter